MTDMLPQSTVSIIVPLYQGKKYVPRLICMAETCSRLAGNPVKIELVLSNDDPDEEIPENIFSDIIDVIVMNTEKNRGIHSARKTGFDKANGGYVIFLDQDDVIYPEYVKSQLTNIGVADAIICKAINGGREFYDCGRPFEEMTSPRHMFLSGNGILSPGQVMMRRESVSLFWQENILCHNGADDWMLWLCMLYEGRSFAQNQDILYEHMLGNGNYSGSVYKMYQSEIEVYEVLSEQKYFDIRHLALLKQAIQKGIEIRLKELDRLKVVEKIYDMWMIIKRKNGSVAQMLKRRGYRTVAIYGMSKIGLHLYQEIEMEIEVKCFIDRNAVYLRADIPICTLDDNISQVDMVIVALADREQNVLKEISSKLHIPIRNIEDILRELLAEE